MQASVLELGRDAAEHCKHHELPIFNLLCCVHMLTLVTCMSSRHWMGQRSSVQAFCSFDQTFVQTRRMVHVSLAVIVVGLSTSGSVA